MLSDPTKQFYIYYKELNFFINFILKDLYIYDGPRTGPQGIPWKKVLKIVANVITKCNGTDAIFPNVPTEEQINAMNATQRWGEVGKKSSIEIEFDLKFLNSSFVQCIITETDQEVHDYEHQFNKGLLIVVGLIGAIVLIGLAAWATYSFLSCQKKSNNHGENKQLIFGSNDKDDETIQMKDDTTTASLSS